MKRKYIMIGLLLLLVLSACSNKDQVGLTGDEDVTPASSVAVDETYAQKISDKVPLHLYFGSSDGNTLKMEVRYIPMKDAKKSVSELAGIVVKELLAGPTASQGMKAVIPPGTALNGNPVYKNGTITVDLSTHFAQSLQGDAVKEKLAVFSIVNALTEVKEIDRVKFLFDGKEKKDYKGKLKLDAVFPRNPSLINIVSDQYTRETGTRTGAGTETESAVETSLEVMEVLD